MKKTKLSLLALASLMGVTFGGVLVSCGGNNNDSTSQGQEVDVGLTVSETEVVLNANETKQITVSTQDDSLYLIRYESSDKNVATVKAGLITAVNKGEATITVSVSKKGSLKVLQSKKIHVVVTDHSLTIDQEEVDMYLNGDSLKLTVSVHGEGANTNITWTSSDESIATVDSEGNVTAKKKGDVTIKASNGQVFANCKVHVKTFGLEKKREVAKEDNVNLLTFGTLPSDVVWTSSDTNIATVATNAENGTVTVTAKNALGMVKITATSASDESSATCVVMVKGKGEEVKELTEGKKADAAKNPGEWNYLREDYDKGTNNVQIGSTPTIDNGLIHVDITRVGDANGDLKGSNFFYLRYQPDETGDIIYNEDLYFYSENPLFISINNGQDTNYPAGYNKISVDFTSVDPKQSTAPASLKFKCTGVFDILPVFTKTGEVKKMKLSEESKQLDLNGEKEFTLTATVPDGETSSIVWKSNNEEVATVDENGKVTAKAIGVATITATCGSYSASCSIEVINSSTPDTREDLTIGKDSVVLANRGKWYYYDFLNEKGDSNSGVFDYHKIDNETGKIYTHVVKNKNANGATKSGCLKYAPVNGKYVASYSIIYSGDEECSVTISCGQSFSEDVTVTKNEEKTGTFNFEITESSKKPFQLKFNALGDYEFHVTFAPTTGE